MMEKLNRLMYTITIKMINFYEFLDRNIILPFYLKIIRFLNAVTEKKIKRYGLESDWKEKTLQDFRLWLADVPENKADQNTHGEDCDLYTLLAEFSGLRQEIRLQNREQSKSVKTVNSFMDSFQAAFGLMKQNYADLKHLEVKISGDAEKKVLSRFFEVRDTLERALFAARKKRAAKGVFSRGKSELDSIIEGYEIGLRRFDRAMAFSGVEPVDALGKKFDPKTMKAVSVAGLREKRMEKESGQESGNVIEQISGGFLRGREVLKYAEVIVAK